MSAFSRPKKATRAGTTRHPSLRLIAPNSQSAPAYDLSDDSYIDTGNFRIRRVREPDLELPTLPPNVTEITIRRGARVVMLHAKRRPSDVLNVAAKYFGTPDQD